MCEILWVKLAILTRLLIISKTIKNVISQIVMRGETICLSMVRGVWAGARVQAFSSLCSLHLWASSRLGTAALSLEASHALPRSSNTSAPPPPFCLKFQFQLAHLELELPIFPGTLGGLHTRSTFTGNGGGGSGLRPHRRISALALHEITGFPIPAYVPYRKNHH